MVSKLPTTDYRLFRKAEVAISDRVLTKRSAFTLIELLVVVVLIGILSAIATDMFFNITRSYNKANVIAEIGQNGNLALATMGNEIRNALSVSPTSGVTQTLQIVNQAEETVTLAFVPPCGDAGEPSCPGGGRNNGYVARSGQRITDDTLATGVNVTSLQFEVSGTQPLVVRITITLSQPKGVPSRIDFQAETTLETTVSLRTY